MARQHRPQISYGPQEQVSARPNDPHGLGEIGGRALTAEEARIAFERAFAELFQRQMNERVIRQAELRGAVTVRHG